MDNYRTYTFYTFITLVLVFVFMWVTDAISVTVNPSYQPFLHFLQIFKSIMEMIWT